MFIYLSKKLSLGQNIFKAVFNTIHLLKPVQIIFQFSRKLPFSFY